MRKAAAKARAAFKSTAHVRLAQASTQPSKQAAASHFKRRGRNAKKHTTRFFVFPELVTGDPTAQHRLQASSTVSRLLKDLRVPTAGLPIRFFLRPEQPTPETHTSHHSSRAVAIPDFRTVHALAKAGKASSTETLTALISSADSLRTLDALLSAGRAADPSSQAHTTAAGFIRLNELVSRASAAAYTHFPCNLHGALPHVAASASLQGRPVAAGGAGLPALLLESGRSLARRRLLPALSDHVAAAWTPAELAGVAQALVWLQAESDQPLASEFWEHVKSVAQGGKLTVSDMGPAGQVFNAISRAQTSLPPAALDAKALLQPEQTWLAPQHCNVAAALAQQLPPAQAIACWLAAHSPEAGPPDPATASSAAPPNEARSAAHDAADEQPCPWKWLGRPPAAQTSPESHQGHAVHDSNAVRQALHSRLLQLAPAGGVQQLDGSGGTLSWSQHGHEILSALHAPLHPQARRAALRPLFAVAVEAVVQPGAREARGARRLIAVGHLLGVMDLANMAGAALKPHHGDAVQQFLAVACEELQAHTDVLSAHEVASSVLLLGELLSMQGTYTRLRSDPAYSYLAGLFCSESVQALQFTSMERMMLCSGIQRLFGSRARNVWCSQLDAHLSPKHADPSARRTQGPGTAMQVPLLHAFCQRLSDLAATPLSATPVDASEEARCMLTTFGAIGLKYQDVIAFLRAAVASLHAHLRHSGGEGYSNKALAHVLLALGELQVPFETVFPLVLQICDLLLARVHTMDTTECYLVVDALAKLRTPTPEAAPLLLAIMAHLASGLELRPLRPALRHNLLSTPPSQLIKLATAIKGFMPQTHGVVTREMQTAPKAAFVRLLVSHLMRNCAADLTHRDLIRILRLLKDSALGRDVPKPWTQDAALRIVDRFNSHLFGVPAQPLDETAYWQGQELRDVTYLGVASAAPVPKPRRLPLTPQLLADSGTIAGAAALAASDLLPEGEVEEGRRDRGRGVNPDVEPVRWAYGKAYGVVQDSNKLILGSLKVMDWDTHLLHAVETLVGNMGPRGLAGQPTVLDQTLTTEGTHMQVWRQAGFHGQDAPEEPPDPRTARGRGRGGRGQGYFKAPFVVPHAPDPATLEDGGTNRPMQMHRGLEPFDAAALLVAIADVYGDSASGGRTLCLRIAPDLFMLYAPQQHRTADLARMLWALGVLTNPAEPQLWRALPDVCSALRLCNRSMHRMHPKFTMLAMKGMAAMARGGLLHDEPVLARPWQRFVAAADTEEARRTVRLLDADANTFAKRAAGFLASTLSAEMSKGRTCSLRPEGIGEAMRAATLLCPASTGTLASLWGVGAQVLREHATPQDVPLRAVTALLEAAPTVLASAPAVGKSTGRMLQVARTRLLHGRRRVAPLQVRRFVAALRLAAPVANVRDGGLVTAVLREAAGVPMIANAKRRGHRGAERFVRMFEEIAELGEHGVVFSGAGGNASAGAGATVRADETLVQRLEAVIAVAEAACTAQVHADGSAGDGAAGTGPGMVAQTDFDARDEAEVLEGTEPEDAWDGNAESTAGVTPERLDYTLEGRVERMPWKESAWDEQLVLRLRAALNTIQGR
eukprot:jgi/Ulvmu1/4870/UM020_0156.1